MPLADTLLKKYPIISDQVDRTDVHEVLEQLEAVLDKNISGAVVEFGCYIGTTSLFIRRLLEAKHADRPFHVYDSFAGLPPKAREDESPAGAGFQLGMLAVSKKQLVREFQKAGLQVPTIHKGWFEQLTIADIPEQIALAFLDSDFYSSMLASLKLVLPRMSRGGVIIIDDYVREALPGVAKAVAALGLTPAVRHGLGILRVV